MSCDRLPGNREALDAISALTGRSRSDITAEFHAECSGGDRTRADPADVEQVLRSLINRVRNAPALAWDRKAGLQDTLTAMLTDPPDRSNAQVDAWRHLVRHHPQEIRTLDRPPVALPVMDEPQETAWHALMDFDRDLDEPWVLVGGQMTMIHCLEHGVDGYRATDDGDIVLGVWTRRDALSTAARLLLDRGFAVVDTSDGFGYRYARGTTVMDLLLPEGLERQRNQPKAPGGRPGLPVEGGNQALIRAERLPVRLADRTGHVLRPSLLGALVSKSAALVADSRDPERHRDDIALLGQVAYQSGMRELRDQATPNDRRRLRKALATMPDSHPSWRRIQNPVEVRDGLTRLSAV